jgi:cytochrome c oxidase subunit I
MTTVALERPRPTGAIGWLASTDHKRIGLLQIGAAFVFFIASGIAALLMRAELAEPGMQVVSRQSYNELFTLHGSGMIYLTITPLALAVGIYLVPLQIGAAQIAWPRWTLLGLWLVIAGGVIMYLGLAVEHGAARSGWFATYPLSDSANASGKGQDMWICGVFLAVLGVTIQSATLLATIVRKRAPGMTMARLSPFVWSMLATVLLAITSFPVLLGTMAALEWDRLHGGVFDGHYGPVAYQLLFWFYGHPVVYVMFFPFVGMAAEAVSAFSARRFFAYKGFTLSILLFAALSMSVWAHHMFATGRVNNEYFSLTSTMLIVPAGLEYFAIVGTMVGGAIVFSTAMLFAIGFLLLFLIGGLTGIIVASPPLDYHLTDSYFYVAHFHYALFGGSLFGFFAGVYYWFPKVTGALLRESLGKLQFVLFVIGANLTFFPMLALGFEGMPRRVATYPSRFTTLNVVETVGGLVIALGVLVFLVNVWWSLRHRVPSGNDPFGGPTLEWFTTSPPPRLNYDSLPPIRSYAPLFDLLETGAPAEPARPPGRRRKRASGDRG